ncbi:zinc finger, CCHC-type containing protein [Tanacetum coccineum]
MVAPVISVSADSPEESFGDTIEIIVDVIHHVPITLAVFPASTVVMRLVEHWEEIQDMAEIERITLHARVRSLEVVETWLHGIVRDEREARARIERQLGLVQEELESLRRLRTIRLNLPIQILNAQAEAMKEENVKEGNLRVMNKDFETRPDRTPFALESFSHLRIEESLMVQDNDKPKSNNVAGPSVVNMVEHNNSSRYNYNKGKHKHHDNTRDDPNKKAKHTCWKCGKTGHIKRDCKGVNVDNKANGSGTKGLVDGSSNSLKGATVHVCKDRCWFKTYESLNDGSILHMGNESSALVHGRGCVYLSNQMFKFNVVHDNTASAFMSTSKLNDSILWHARLGHVQFKRMQDMSKDGLILAFDMDTKKWNKKYFVTFIDDASRFCYVYLLHSKDEALDKFKVFKTEVELQQGSLIKRFMTDRGVVPEEVTEVVQQPEPELRKSKRNRTPKNFGPEFQLYLIEATREKVSGQHSYCFNIEDDPKTFNEAMKSKNVAFWKEAINDEMDSIMGNITWVLADLPLGFKPLGCKWIFKRKLKVDGTIEKFKARLVTQGFRQKSGINYFDTYALVARISTIRLLIVIASLYNLTIHQMDTKTAFLIGELEEESHYIEKVLNKFNYFDCTPVSTSMDTSEKLMPNNGQAVSQLEYIRVTGCLMYAMTCTRPDIAFVVGKLSMYTIILASKKQTCITGSTMESEFVALTTAGKEAEWLRNLILKIPLWFKPIAPISICYDSAVTLAKAYRQMYNGKSRHLGVRHSMIRELIKNGWYL